MLVSDDLGVGGIGLGLSDGLFWGSFFLGLPLEKSRLGVGEWYAGAIVFYCVCWYCIGLFVLRLGGTLPVGWGDRWVRRRGVVFFFFPGHSCTVEIHLGTFPFSFCFTGLV